MKQSRFFSGILFTLAIVMGIVQTGIAKTTLLGSFIVPNGVPGVNGTNGAAGESALEIWCRANDKTGNDCTDAAFLAAITGKDGKDGKDGTSIHVKGTVASCSNLPNNATEGDIYIVTNQNNYGYMWNGTSWNCPKKPDNTEGGFPIKGEDGADGCDIQLQTAASSTPGCTTLKWIKSFKSDGTCQAKNTGDAWGSLEVCNGNDGDNGTGVCDVSESDKSKTVKREERNRQNPTWDSSAGVFTGWGYYDGTTHYCDNTTKKAVIKDDCDLIALPLFTSANSAVQCPSGLYYTCKWPTNETIPSDISSHVSDGKYNVCISTGSVPVQACEPAEQLISVGADCQQKQIKKQVWDVAQSKCVEASGATWTNVGSPICPQCKELFEYEAQTGAAKCSKLNIYEQTRNSSYECVRGAKKDTREFCSACDTEITSETGTGRNLGCTRTKYQKKKGADCSTDDGDPTYGDWTCDGASPVPLCPKRVYATAKNTSGCSDVKAMPQEWNATSSKCVDKTGATEETLVTTCDGDVGPVGPSACDADNATNTTVDTIVRSYHRPTKANTGDKYYATYGGIDETVTYCKDGGTSPNFIQDSCNPLTRTAASSISATGTGTCAGTVLECSTSLTDTGSGGMGNAGTKYYVCSDVCAKTAATYTQPTLTSGSDSNCLNNGKCASLPGKTVTNEYNGCKDADIVKHVDTEDTCVDPVVNSCSTSVSSSGVCTYYTCTVGDSTGKVSDTITAKTYTLRKPLTDNNSVFKIASDAKTKATANESALASKADTSALSSYLTSANAENIYATKTALDAKLNTNDLSATLTKTMITNKLGTDTYGSASDVSALKTTVGNNSSGLVKDVADASAAAATATSIANSASDAASAADSKATAAQNTANSKIGQSDLNTALYGTGTSSNPASGSIAYKANNAATTTSVNTALYGSGGTASSPASGSIAAKANLGGSALQPSALYGTGSSSSPAAGSIAYKANNAATTTSVNTALYGSGGTASSPASGSIAAKANAALPADNFNQTATDWASTTNVSNSRNPAAGSVLALVNTAQATASAAQNAVNNTCTSSTDCTPGLAQLYEALNTIATKCNSTETWCSSLKNMGYIDANRPNQD